MRTLALYTNMNQRWLLRVKVQDRAQPRMAACSYGQLALFTPIEALDRGGFSRAMKVVSSTFGSNRHTSLSEQFPDEISRSFCLHISRPPITHGTLALP
jgi:hypothetical protein